MRTAVITHNQEECSLFVVDGDWTKFNGVYVNGTDTGHELELSESLFPAPDYQLFQKEATLEEFAEAIRAGATVIKCGFVL